MLAALDDIPGHAQRTRTCAFWLVGPVLYARFLPQAEVTLADATENVALTGRIAAGQRLAVLVDLRACRAQSADARAYLAGPEANAVSCAVGLLIGSPVSRVLGNFYLGFNRPSVPTRLFTHERAALAWLESIPRGQPS